ncbi:MAG: hypothetical protein OXP69_00935 [Spirochaetaceae bacterium]|nr:hypothetical protein [Spirochaetaceae bacterium]
MTAHRLDTLPGYVEKDLWVCIVLDLIAFRQAWKRFEEATPGSVQLVPQAELKAAIDADYGAMRDMILGDVPDFGWIMEQLQYAESTVNGT